MTKVSVGIAAIPERKQDVIGLVRELDYPDVYVAWDMNHRGSWYGHKQAIMSMTDDATHHLVLEDDVHVGKNFMEAVHVICSLLPEELISLYATFTHRPKFEWARKRGYSWYRSRYGASGQAIVMSASLWREFFMWERKCPPKMPYEDSRLWGWAYETNRFTWNSVPCLVDHLRPTESSLGSFFNNEKKVAADFLDDLDLLDVDWSLGIAELTTDPRPKQYRWGKNTYFEWIGHIGERHVQANDN